MPVGIGVGGQTRAGVNSDTMVQAVAHAQDTSPPRRSPSELTPAPLAAA